MSQQEENNLSSTAFSSQMDARNPQSGGEDHNAGPSLSAAGSGLAGKNSDGAKKNNNSQQQQFEESQPVLYYEEMHGSLHAEEGGFVQVPTNKIVKVLIGKYLEGEDRTEESEETSSTKGNTQKKKLKEDFLQFVESVSLVVQCHYTKKGNFVKEYWECKEYPPEDELPPLPSGYHLAAENLSTPPTKEQKKHLDTIEKCGLDLRLLDRIGTILHRAQYKPLTPQLFRLASQTSYEINFPLDVPWDELEDECLPLWIRCNPVYSEKEVAATTRSDQEGQLLKGVGNVGGKPLPPKLRSLGGNIAGAIGKRKDDFFNYFLVFTRGVTQRKRSGFFLFEKIDIALELLWTWILFKLGCLDSDGKKTEHPAELIKKTREEGAAEPVDFSQEGKNSSSSSSSGAGRGAAAAPPPLIGRESGDGATKRVELQRLTLRQHLLNKGWQGFFQSAELHEPHSRSPSPLNNDNNSLAASKQQHRHRTALRIREFRDIPYGDLEAIIPTVKVGMPPLDTIKFAIQLIMVIWFLKLNIDAVFDAEVEPRDSPDAENISNSTALLLVMLLIGLGGKLVGLVFYFMGVILYYQRILENWLLQKRVGQGPVVVSSLCDDVVFQDTRELVLAYFFLWHKGIAAAKKESSDPAVVNLDPTARRAEEMTMKELDEMVEGVLLEEFRLRIDFDVEDAVAKLITMGLVSVRYPISKGAGGGVVEHGEEEGLYRVYLQPGEWNEMHPVSQFSSVDIYK